MPLYDYECPKCGYKKEVMHSMNNKPTIKCDKCGELCKKVITAPRSIQGEYDLGTKYKQIDMGEQ